MTLVRSPVPGSANDPGIYCGASGFPIYLPCSYTPRFICFESPRVLSFAQNHPICRLLCTNCAPTVHQNLASIRSSSTFLASHRSAQISSGTTRCTSFANAPALGAGGREFKSRRPDQMYPAYFLKLIESTVHPKLRCGILAGRRSEFASPLILEICFRLNIQEYRPKERKFRNY